MKQVEHQRELMKIHLEKFGSKLSTIYFSDDLFYLTSNDNLVCYDESPGHILSL
jgi:hypothetical protein